MSDSEIKFYYKNVTAEIIDVEHGITSEQIETLAKQTSPLIIQLNEQRKAGKTPYRNLPYSKETPKTVKDLVAKVKDDCENLVVLGIGGSALGNIALQTALNPYMYNLDDAQRPVLRSTAKDERGPRLFVFDNVDPAQLVSFLDWLDKERLKHTIFNVISQSGRTIETLTQFMIIRQRLRELSEDAYKRQVVVTTKFKDKVAKKPNILCEITFADELPHRLDFPEDVPGRFSVLSNVGLFSAAMCGIDIDALLAGARDMDKRVSCEDFYENPAAINAAINYYFYNHGKKISVMMPYSYHLKDLADWYRQLWAESLGKAYTLDGSEVYIGPTPIKTLGTTDQHSQVQLYREGPNDKLFTFLQVDNFNKDLKISPVPDCVSEFGFLAGKDLSTLLNNEKKATEYALLDSNRPCLTVIFPEVNAYTVGQFIYLFEVTTSFAGALFGINPYDQPAVELGKEATFALMGMDDKEYKDLVQQIRDLTEVDNEYLV